MNVLDRIQDYLSNGGLFDPDLMDDNEVSKLIRDCRDVIKDLITQIEDSDKMLFNQSQTIKEQHEINERCNQTIKELRFVNIMEDTVAKVQSVKCKVSDPYVNRAPVAEFTWFIYNKSNGHIVASTYCKDMANAILFGIDNNPAFIDDYAICEQWRGPEPMV